MQFGARCLNYCGDVSTDVLGRVMGPNDYGEPLIAIAAHYDAESDRTRVQFRYSTPAERVALARPDSVPEDVRPIRDAFGQWRLPGEYEVLTYRPE